MLQLGKRVAGSSLLGFLFVSPPSRLIALAGHLSDDFEALAMIRTLFIEQMIRRRAAEFALGELLQERLVVSAELARRSQLHFRADVRIDELPGRLVTAVEINAGHQGF